MYSINQLYTQQSESINPCDSEPALFDGLSKLSLFKKKSEEFDSAAENQCINHLLKFLTSTIYFRKIEGNQLIGWEVFATNSDLSAWVEEKIGQSNYDYLVWPNKHLEPPKLLVFDMDSTFIQIEVIDQLAFQHGVGESVSKVTEAAMRGELDFSESLVSRVACLQGLTESTIGEIANDLPLSIGVDQLVSQCHKNDVKVAIVSGGFTPFVTHLKNKMDLYEVKANNLEIAEGRLTGKVLGKIVDAKAKADFVNKLASDLELQVNDILTIGDGANDLLMMNESGFSLAYRAKPAVQAEANGRMNFTTLADLISIFEW